MYLFIQKMYIFIFTRVWHKARLMGLSVKFLVIQVLIYVSTMTFLNMVCILTSMTESGSFGFDEVVEWLRW